MNKFVDWFILILMALFITLPHLACSTKSSQYVSPAPTQQDVSPQMLQLVERGYNQKVYILTVEGQKYIVVTEGQSGIAICPVSY
jgi:hypothetical protein